MTRSPADPRPRRRAVLLLLVLGGCGDASTEPDPGARLAEPVPPGSVPRGSVALRASAMAPGPPVTPALLQQGELAFRGKCVPCHGATLAGDGPVVLRGFPAPPRLEPREHAAEHVVDVVTHGRGEMPAMSGQVPPLERWAIARWLERR